MKSFAAKVRDTLTREGDLRADDSAVLLAELSGLVLSCGSISLAGGGQLRLAMRTRNAGTARWIMRLLRGQFGVSPGLRMLKSDRLGGRTTVEIRLEGEDASRVLAVLSITPLQHAIPRVHVASQRKRDALLRGMFLGCGTVSDPQRGYQLEFSFASEAMAQEMRGLLEKRYGLGARVHTRRGMAVVYLKGGDDIVTVLSHIGAHSALLEMENIRITKDARNRANRAANCDSGNITKTLDAAEKQLAAIDRIERTIGLDALPDTLREMAIERRLHADASLEALGAQMDPPVGKSGVSHRLGRIVALAQTLAPDGIENEKGDEPHDP